MPCARHFFVICLLLLFAAGCSSLRPQGPAPYPLDHGFRFAKEKINATMVVRDPKANTTMAWQDLRANTPFPPAPTFHIMIALVAIETGAATPDTLFSWDHTDRGWAGWNRDLTLEEAFSVSAIWVFQNIAKTIGKNGMADWVKRCGYGNQDVSGSPERFWMDGGLRITTRQQVRFLERLWQGDLPFSPETMDAVREMMKEETSQEAVLRASDGSTTTAGVRMGWYVGWVERIDGSVRIFATNTDIRDVRNMDAKKRITKEILKDLAIYP